MGTYSYSGSIQKITVQTTGAYDITGYGGSGGAGGHGTTGGLGAEESGTFQLTAGETLEIVVAGAGTMPLSTSSDYPGAGGGGGGTFVLANIGAGGAYIPILVAGGGGGGYRPPSGDGTTGASGDGSGGAAGNAFNNYSYAGAGGAGVNGSGSDANGARYGGYGGADANGVGGGFLGGGGSDGFRARDFEGSGRGGFGGGGGGGLEGGGGGGGYTGGNGGYFNTASSGGTSYDAGTPIAAMTRSGENTGAGKLLITPSAVCYVSGTRIHTTRGDVAVEHLRVGDLVVTAVGEERPIRWLGRRDLDASRHADPTAVRPVRVQAGAFGKGLPRRDLWLSPGHSVYVDDMLMPIRALINHATIAPVPLDRFTYWHVELDSHDVILAEGLPAESYVDTGNRSAFFGGCDFLELHPDFEPQREAAKCAPLKTSGPEVQKVRMHLLRQAQALGFTLAEDADLHVVADGVRLGAERLSDLAYAFTLPQRFGEVRLVSRRFVPAETVPGRRDRRELGVFVQALAVDGSELSLALLHECWHALEGSAGQYRRWTTGDALLPIPAGTRRLTVGLRGHGRYLVAPEAVAVREIRRATA